MKGSRILSASVGFVLFSLGFCAPTSAQDAAPILRNDLTAKDQARVSAVTRATEIFSDAEKYENMSGGAGTLQSDTGRNAFSHFSENLDFAGQEQFNLGNGLFRKIWVSSPSSTNASDGLGPIYNARSCQRCHLKDGRGHPPDISDTDASTMFLRLSVPARTEAERQALASKKMLRIPEPTYGGQFQDFAVPGLDAEGQMVVTYEERPVTLNGGQVVSLRAPTYSVKDLAYGPMDPDVMLSPRVAPPMIGLGLLEAIAPADILSQADPDDLNGDGISGRPSMVWDPVADGIALGRFGWKASKASLKAQAADAFAGDIGISTPMVPNHWGDCTEAQRACRQMATGVQVNLGDTEAPDPILDLVEHYSRNLAVPARRDVADPTVLRGKKVFYESGCVACHTPKYVTSRNADQPEHRFQLIWPYTDLLLHDMGEGLSDHRPVGDAQGQEWRTPPLWGIGLTEVVSGHTFFLHDGRARNLLEAILWHGGEAQAARDKVVELSLEDRNALIQFLESL
ncbi:MAG: thiol oxidoreductase [Rhodospirillaceae bacterium]|jgi:CxxC motif-containing protein (DUF1111 family)|uniref:di-heme oxidoreductase family protein n=1 Tax=Hwanghaeella sp. 1Z406 TaxID=3402811 RepID=UPI000C699694|nr:thiol oxidoreductase [Rhodospirillales bacterium]MAX49154.1 thiol oxidoreductase [Rhodospirillaceae bacterium]|tara:strand:- start:6542 stop:8077 length:1536 start_codon:yes stop_codon:yes gene_type:complete